ncbi:ATP-dependent RNA helicase dbp10 [Exophiala xenobiotica]|nr:ATP-dependent RNA helicase dbp10 [Exophiala xenobiotica]KAK5288931.1 ATP-dependent RNA helicase dbp10 [Exophiala xenobiotica]KAK5361562.1 ATP-dependent RNA helicase dbp10 [Exophiala xenobiotica]KAK5368500.1 ATP-dependent RNA helicase dbp10 [Exophiala xenobiotica]KAK5422378.1 ATP-dependent RNA helicase dbp10 [Exophiala xenobiotica]
MGRRSGSPARSENEFDIGSALFGGDDVESSGILLDKQNGDLQNGDLDVMAEGSGSDDEAIIAAQQAASNRKSSNLKGRTVKKGGAFQSMGLNANLLKAITRKGFSVPTPIQRKTIPLLLNDKDVVGMARTGSGKTAAFVIPMIEKLKVHSTKVGARALILSPSRELALQTLTVVKELGRGADLRSILLVGGDSLEEQFSAMSNNPDIIIATPGRFLHLKVEMGLDLSSMKYVVFDEADRLFEMGFAAQLTEILHALPASRQTLLFSATLPKSLVEFARAGLQDPVLVRLDADSKISPDLQSAFFTLKSSEKEGALLFLLQEIIKVPTRTQLISSTTSADTDKPSKKRKRKEADEGSALGSDPYSTIVFAATKHHVEYLAHLIRSAGYAVSYAYGSLDQTARKTQVHAFRTGQTNILVVTDVAARGIDIPVLANVINYDFPSQPKIYVHRVGRTARAGQKGWSYSLVRDNDAPYLLDLQLFLGRKLSIGRANTESVNFAQDVVVGGLRRDDLHTTCEWVTKSLQDDSDLFGLRSVASKGEKLYQRTRNSASSESAKRAKGLVSSEAWSELHPLFNDQSDDLEAQREAMLARVGGFRPQESIFEFSARRGGRKNNEDAVDAIRKIRSGLETRKQKSQDTAKARSMDLDDDNADTLAGGQLDHDSNDEDDHGSHLDFNDAMSEASSGELEVTFSNQPYSKRHKTGETTTTSSTFRDPENFMSYHPTSINMTDDKAYGVHSGSNTNFTEAARSATMDLAMDEASKTFGEARSIMRWDKRHKKYVRRDNDDDGSKNNKRLVRGESGAKIAASFRSGRFDRWKKDNRIKRVARTGEAESKTFGSSTSTPAGNGAGPGAGLGGLGGNKRFRHKTLKMPKAPDKFREDYEKQKKKATGAKERTENMAMTGNKKELRSVDHMVKERRSKEKRREKNARPSRKSTYLR